MQEAPSGVSRPYVSKNVNDYQEVLQEELRYAPIEKLVNTSELIKISKENEKEDERTAEDRALDEEL